MNNVDAPNWLKVAVGALDKQANTSGRASRITWRPFVVALTQDTVRGDGDEPASSASGALSAATAGGTPAPAVRATLVDGHLIIEVVADPNSRPWLIIRGMDPVPLEPFEGSLQAAVPWTNDACPREVGFAWPTS